MSDDNEKNTLIIVAKVFAIVIIMIICVIVIFHGFLVYSFITVPIMEGKWDPNDPYWIRLIGPLMMGAGISGIVGMIALLSKK